MKTLEYCLHKNQTGRVTEGSPTESGLIRLHGILFVDGKKEMYVESYMRDKAFKSSALSIAEDKFAPDKIVYHGLVDDIPDRLTYGH